MNQNSQLQWYYEPWAWFNILIFTVAIVSACLMTYVAVRNSPAEIDSSWYQDGPLMKQERKIVTSVTLPLRAEMVLRGADIKLSLELKSNASKAVTFPDTLKLYLEHPSNPELDQRITLSKDKLNTYRGSVREGLKGKRFLMLSENNKAWNMIATAYFPASETITFSYQEKGNVVND